MTSSLALSDVLDCVVAFSKRACHQSYLWDIRSEAVKRGIRMMDWAPVALGVVQTKIKFLINQRYTHCIANDMVIC